MALHRSDTALHTQHRKAIKLPTKILNQALSVEEA